MPISSRLLRAPLLTMLAFAPLHAAAQETATMAEVETALDVAPMDCPAGSIALDCVSEYLTRVGTNLEPYVDERLSQIVVRLNRAEAVEEDFDEIIRIAEGLGSMSAEGGAFTQELDRIGALIQDYRDDAATDPDQRDDILPMFDTAFADWQSVRDRLATVREDAADAVALLRAKRARAISLMRLSQIQAAIREAEAGIAGMESVLDALNDLATAASSPAQAQTGSD